ncbi:DUF4097 family beta strand repeat-containing protein [Aeromicrobium sp.]|uniref:DUF4097 family beta strand repeat-containing protein n=1 Tax=Aeromicrobium sp. TaxID=1871063 RepID=UPI003D6A28A9
MAPHRRLDDGERRPWVRTLITVVVTVGIIAIVLGALAATSLASSSTRTAANRIDVGDEPQLAIRSTDADVRLVEGTSSDIVIRAEVTSGLLETGYELRRRGHEIEVVGSCMNWLSPGCGVVVTVAVPPKLPVLVATDTADVTVSSLRDRVVTIATGSGDIRGSGLRVQEFSARAHDGDIDANFAEQPFALKARSRSGDIFARIPIGVIDYSLHIGSGSGDVRSGIKSVRGGKGIVQVVSDSGDILLRR